MSAIPMELPVNLPDATGSGKYKMARLNFMHVYLSL